MLKSTINIFLPLQIIIKNKNIFLFTKTKKENLNLKNYNKLFLIFTKKYFTKIYILNNKNNKNNKTQIIAFKTILQNIIIGLTIGFYLKLIFIGVNYRFKKLKKLNRIILTIGNSYTTIFKIPNKVQIYVFKKRSILIYGTNIVYVSHIAFFLQALCKPNIYTGKGLKFKTEIIKTKIGKRTKK